MRNIKLYRNLMNDEKFMLSKDNDNNGRFLLEVMNQIKNNPYPFYSNHPIELNKNSYLIKEQMNFHFYTYSDIIINLKNLIGIDEEVLIKSGEAGDSKTSSIVCFSESNTDNEGMYESEFRIALNTKKAKKIDKKLNGYENNKFLIRSYELSKLVEDKVIIDVVFKQNYLSDKKNSVYDSLDELIYFILKDLKIKINDSYMHFMDFLRWNLEFIAEEITDEKEIKDYLIKEGFK